MNKVIVYSKTVCGGCAFVKNFFNNREDVEMEVRNVETNEEYKKEYDKYGFQSVPLTVINDSEPVVGFNPILFEKALK